MSKLLVVIDTNVLISVALRRPSSIPDRIHQALKKQKFIFITSTEILEEIEEVLSREGIVMITKMTAEEQKKFIQDLIDVAFIVPGNVTLKVVEKDPEDDKFIAAAIEGKADYIVSGDKPVLNLKEYHGIKVVSPSEFIHILSKRMDS